MRDSVELFRPTSSLAAQSCAARSSFPDYKNDKTMPIAHAALEPAKNRDEPFIIGQGVGSVGRWLRLFLGVYFLIFLVLNPLYLHPLSSHALPVFALTVGGYFLLLVALHFIVFFLISDPILSKLNPWAGTGIFVGIPTVLGLLGVYPQPLQVAFGLYVSGSLVLIFFMRYGGCEVVALPSLLLKRRFTVYCPYNAIDAIERAMTPDKGWARQRLLTIFSLAIVIFVGGYFIVVASNDLLGQYGVVVRIDHRWSLLLLVPCAQLAVYALKHYRAEHDVFAPQVRKYGLGAVILALTIVAFLFEGTGITGDVIWLAAMGLGALVVLFQVGTRLARRQWHSRKPA
ncbi:MAG TPA: DUF6410 domain-containing protein [Rhodanobacteraceae bacterium]|nr:DUF6410 domain-containing protein [Rhodanobacteraceae bacterium]